MTATHISGPLSVTGASTVGGASSVAGALSVTGAVYQGAAAGAAGGYARQIIKKTAVADATATTVATITIPNVAASAVFRILVRSTLTGANAYESTRTVEYLVTVARKAGVNVVGAISAAVGAQIATVAAGATLTSTLSLAAVVGGVGASNTIPIQVTNTGSVAQVSETEIVIETLNGATGGVTVA